MHLTNQTQVINLAKQRRVQDFFSSGAESRLIDVIKNYALSLKMYDPCTKQTTEVGRKPVNSHKKKNRLVLASAPS